MKTYIVSARILGPTHHRIVVEDTDGAIHEGIVQTHEDEGEVFETQIGKWIELKYGAKGIHGWRPIARAGIFSLFEFDFDTVKIPQFDAYQMLAEHVKRISTEPAYTVEEWVEEVYENRHDGPSELVEAIEVIHEMLIPSMTYKQLSDARRQALLDGDLSSAKVFNQTL